MLGVRSSSLSSCRRGRIWRQDLTGVHPERLRIAPAIEIDLIVLITKVSPEPVVRAMTIASLAGLTPKIMHGLWQKLQGKLEVTPTRQFTLTILVRRSLVPKAILRVCARNVYGLP
jgi:hypothetical protein